MLYFNVFANIETHCSKAIFVRSIEITLFQYSIKYWNILNYWNVFEILKYISIFISMFRFLEIHLFNIPKYWTEYWINANITIFRNIEIINSIFQYCLLFNNSRIRTCCYKFVFHYFNISKLLLYFKTPYTSCNDKTVCFR